MTTQTVAVLFADWVGSTEVLTRLGETATELLRDTLYRLLRRGADARDGREVRNIGDGMMFVFPSASACVAGAIAIQTELSKFNRDAENELHVRSGASIGDADVAEGDYFGIAVVEAARLCAIADSDQILVSESIRSLARDRAGDVFESLGERELKGFDKPVSIYAVRWELVNEPEPGTVVPLPARLERNRLRGFVGREEPLARLEDALKQVRTDPTRRVVLLSGEAGIGKTSLLSEFAGRAHERGVSVLYGRCEDDLRMPYEPWVEALDHLVNNIDVTVLADHLAARSGDLIPLIPSLAERADTPVAPRSADLETSRHLVFAATVDLLARVSADSPIVIVLDDLHWADRTTVQLLRHVTTSPEGRQLLIVASYRDTDIGVTHPIAELLAALHREADVERIQLTGLDDLELAQLLESVVGLALDRSGLDLRDVLAQETDGNPFFAREMLRHLTESGALTPGDRGWTPAQEVRGAGLPASVREVIGHRVARLGEEARRMLSAAAVIGRTFDIDVLGRVTEVDENDLLDLLEIATHASLIAEVPEKPDSFTFVHALIQRTLYDEIGTTRRRRLHQRTAETLEISSDIGEHIVDLAHHWFEATGPTDMKKALFYALCAGDQARDRLAPDEALHWYRRAFELSERMDDEEQRTDCLVRLGRAQRLAGRSEYRETLLSAAGLAAQRHDADHLAEAVLANHRGFYSFAGKVDYERIKMLDAAIQQCVETNLALRSRLLSRLAQEAFFAPDRHARELLDEALRLAEQSGDPQAKIEALTALLVCYSPGSLECRLSRIPELLDLVERHGDPAQRFWALQFTFTAWLQDTRVAEAASAASKLRTLATEIGDPATAWAVAINEQMLADAFGDLNTAETLAMRTLELGEKSGQPDATLFSGSQLAILYVHRGDWDTAVSLFELALAEHEIVALRTGLASALKECGRTADATVIARPLHDLDIEFISSCDPLGGAIFTGLALCASLLPRTMVEQLETQLSALPGQLLISGATIVGVSELAHGLVLEELGRHKEADGCFGKALDRLRTLGLRTIETITLWFWARALARNTEPGAAAMAKARAAQCRQLALEIDADGFVPDCDRIMAGARV